MDIPNRYPIIAGHHSGKTLRCNPRIKPTYDKLKKAALSGTHAARIAVKELEALSSGPLGKRNVFVKPMAERPRGLDQFVVFLPGLKAIVERHANDQYFLMDLVLDAHYFEATAQGSTRMGLYRVTPKENDEWDVQVVKDGRVLPKDGRVVAVVDAGYESAARAARAVMPKIIGMPNVSASSIRRAGCDLHFTPGERRLGNLRRYCALGHEAAHGSAALLSDTIFQAREQVDVAWIADRGGSVVLTQALHLLAVRGVQLSNHTAYLHHPKSSPGDALQLAHRLNLNLAEAFADTGWGVIGAMSQARVAPQRLNNRRDPYSHGYHANAWINGIMKAAGVAGIAGAGAAALGSGIPVVATIGAIVATSSGAAGAAGTVYALGRSLAEDIKHKINR